MSKKDKLMAHYEKELARMLSNEDFVPFFGSDIQDKIMLYSELKNYETILDLFPKPNGFKIILIEQERHVGHWVMMLRIKGNVIFFDSYGLYPDSQLDFISKIKNKLLGQSRPEVRRLMKGIEKYDLKALYSETKYQADGNGVNTCGRWVCIAIHLLYQLQYSLPEMKTILDKVKEETGKPYDIIAVDFTSK